jgi:hypothetical protein
MPDYQQGRIYTIRCRTDDTLIYVGSTTQSLAKRWGGHKVSSKLNNHFLLYKTINNNWNEWYIELYELYPCNSKEELCRREGDIIRLIGTLNSQIAGRTQKEWVEDNKEYRKKYYKEYVETNKEKLSEYNKVYKKNYRETNKEKLSEYNKEYREKTFLNNRKVLAADLLFL